MKRLTLIRHGLTEGNRKRWYYGALDLPLCVQGEQTLRQAAQAGLYPPCAGARVITSGLLRTEQTLRCICGEVAHESWPELREVSFGVFEGKSYEQLKSRADYQAWLRGDWYENVPPGGESFAQARKRILAGLERMMAQPDDVWAVVHGGTVIVMMQALFPELARGDYDWKPEPGGGYAVELTAHSYQRIGIQRA